MFESSLRDILKYPVISDLNTDPIINAWQKTADFNEGGEPEPISHNTIVTPYGKKIEAYLEEEMGDFDGEGHSMESVFTDEYGIVYGLTGAFVRGYFPDLIRDPEYEYDGHYCWFDRETKFSKMIVDLIDKYPEVMSRIYNILPQEAKDAVIDDIISSIGVIRLPRILKILNK